MHAADGSAHEATVDVSPVGGGSRSAGGSYTVAFDHAGDIVTVGAAGAPADVSVRLGWTRDRALPVAAMSSTVLLSPGETLALRPTSWRALGGAPVAATLTKRSGRVVQLALHTSSASGMSLRSLRIALVRSGRRPTFSMRAATGGVASTARATLAWVLLRGRHVIAVHSGSVPGSQLTGHAYTWRPAALRPGRYTLAAGVALVTGTGGSSVLSSVSQRRRLVFTVR